MPAKKSSKSSVAAATLKMREGMQHFDAIALILIPDILASFLKSLSSSYVGIKYGGGSSPPPLV